MMLIMRFFVFFVFELLVTPPVSLAEPNVDRHLVGRTENKSLNDQLQLKVSRRTKFINNTVVSTPALVNFRNVHFTITSKANISMVSTDSTYIIDLHFNNRTSNVCGVYHDSLVTHDPEIDEIIKRDIGPHEAYVSIAGLGLHAHLFNFVSCNKYKAEFHIRETGSYHVKVVLLRENFNAVDETNFRHPALLYETLMSDWFYLHKPPVGLKIPCTVDSLGVWMLNKDNTTELNRIRAKFSSLKSSKDTVPIKHVGKGLSLRGDLPLLNYVELSPSHNTSLCAENNEYYSWQPTPLCEEKQQSLKHFNQTQASDILRDKNITIYGDSHGRELTKYFKMWACPNNVTNCRGLNLRFIYNAMCEPIRSQDSQANTQDLVLYNCGHHPASGDHWTMRQYINTVKSTVSAALKSGFTNKNFVWFESTPQPMRRDHWVIESQDWRTEARLHMYNVFVHRHLSTQNIAVLSTFRPLLPFIDTMCDNAHYLDVNVVMPVFQQIIHHLYTSENK